MQMDIIVMNSPKVTKPKEGRTAAIGIKTWPSLKEALDQAAADDGRSTSQFIERLVIAHLQETGKWPK
jgi:hypothetical protein